MPDELKAARAEARKYKKHLRELSDVAGGFLAALDVAMTNRESNERGRTIGQLASALDYANDCARHFGLGEPLGKKVKGATALQQAMFRVQQTRMILRELEDRDD